ncbi:MAG: glycoside hydrolase family 2 TIM barrel-domain containing protein [Eubacteriales bacterium]|nr:glycoside hydrolase family 2 TIM barrel-domain containing protein [Eubacteriales bacterium]
MIVPRHYENLHVLHENTMPDRSYYIPASKAMDTLVEHREESDRFRLLNGDWRFRYYESIYDLQEHFYETDYDVSRFDTIPVPGMWQNHGYDRHQYTNIRYPFPFDPPYVPQDNPCGAYAYDFTYESCPEAPDAFLVFEGVDSCFYVWLNGQYVGYSQVSHSTSEFDVTGLLKEGRNRLAVLVLKWCDGSYMEDQDKFRMSGIFRDVYLLNRPKSCIFDYFTRTDCRGDHVAVDVDLTYKGGEIPTKIGIWDAEGNLVDQMELDGDPAGQKSSEPAGQRDPAGGQAKAAGNRSGADIALAKTTVQLEIPNPVTWNAEHPYLYIIRFQTAGEVITDRIGIREIRIVDKVVHVNGRPIVFRGVNRHDSDPVTGFVITMEQLKQDLKMIRQHNFNAIRSSHYPNMPQFYQLCDEYGFYVVDEADNESHGPSELYYADDRFENKSRRWNEAIADNPDYIEATLDRVQRMVERDKNRPSIVIWSMGNECAYGCTFERALKWTKEFDPDRLTHFESARYHSDKRSYDFSNLDLFSRMYPALSEIDEYLDSDPDKPMILIEYCHSMGNGPGDFEEYFQKFHQERLMCGGFVWEWCDHGIYKGLAENGKPIYYYGGDHGEEVHDGNFCMDGLVYPDRTPHTGLLEYKNVHRPIRVTGYDQKKRQLTLRNYLDFTNGRDAVRIRYELNCDGRLVESGVLETPDLKPRQTAEVKLPAFASLEGRTYLKLFYHAAQGTALVPEGHLLGFDEVELPQEDSRCQMAVWAEAAFGQNQDNLVAEENDSCVIVMGSSFLYCLDKRTGMMSRLQCDGIDQITRPMEVNIWRAPTDNDMYIRQEWLRAKYDRTRVRAYETRVIRKKHQVGIHCRMSLGADTVQKILELDTVWTIDAAGVIDLNMKVRRQPEFPYLPRFGVRMHLNPDLDSVEYYGMGPMESYRDKHRAASHGIYRGKVSEMQEDYIRPQENGSHFDCSYVKVDGDRTQLTAVSGQTFSFNASVYSQEQLTRAKHNYELVPENATILCLDYGQSGIGSNSCGPELAEKYRLNEKEFAFNVKLMLNPKKVWEE